MGVCVWEGGKREWVGRQKFFIKFFYHDNSPPPNCKSGGVRVEERKFAVFGKKHSVHFI